MVRKVLLGALALILLATVAVRFAEPVGDGDLFWQMAYGRYMVDHLTLVPDHTVFSWTPTSNETIYCSWVAEIAFYGLYQMGGLPLIFAFRYGCILLTVWLLFDFARRLSVREPRLQLQARPELYLYALLMVLAGYVGTILKPEIFSLVCFHLLAWGYFGMKLEARDPGATPTKRWQWFFPLLMLFWVNSHGVFMFGLIALLILCTGEWLNRKFSPGYALPTPYLRRFTLASALSVVACFITPYGYRYPLQLARELLGMVSGTQSVNDAVAYASLAAHQKITDVPAFHFVPILVFMALSLLWFWGLQWRCGSRGKRIDLALVGVNLAMAALYFWYVRTTYYWPPFWAYTCLYGLYIVTTTSEAGVSIVRPRLVPAVLSALVFVAVCAGSMVQSYVAPYAGSWLGFGISYWNPVLEAEWLERFDPQPRIYNDYDGGGYLLWRLYPQTKVMIDPRSFPYRAWYADYNRFEGGAVFNELLDQFEKADVAVISHKNQALWRNFAASGQWVVAWMGPSSAIFVRSGKTYPAAASEFAPNRFKEIKNFFKTMDTFSMCIELGLYDAAFAVLRAMSENFGRVPEERQVIAAFSRYKDALMAENAELNFEKALLLYEECRREGIFYSDKKLMDLYKVKLQELQAKNVNNANTAAIRDLAIRMAAVNRGEAPPMPLKGLQGPPIATPSP